MCNQEIMLWGPMVRGRTLLLKPIASRTPKRGSFHRFKQRRAQYHVYPAKKRKPEPKRPCAGWSESGQDCREKEDGKKGVKRCLRIRKHSTCDGYGRHAEHESGQRELPLLFHVRSRRGCSSGALPLLSILNRGSAPRQRFSDRKRGDECHFWLRTFAALLRAWRSSPR
jgi:hypothetical protein